MDNFSALEPWHKIQAVILLIIAAVILCKLIAMLLREWWQEYKKETEGIEEWEEEQYNKKADKSQHKQI